MRLRLRNVLRINEIAVLPSEEPAAYLVVSILVFITLLAVILPMFVNKHDDVRLTVEKEHICSSRNLASSKRELFVGFALNRCQERVIFGRTIYEPPDCRVANSLQQGGGLCDLQKRGGRDKHIGVMTVKT